MILNSGPIWRSEHTVLSKRGRRLQFRFDTSVLGYLVVCVKHLFSWSRYDFIGKVENLSEDYHFLRDKFGLPYKELSNIKSTSTG